LGFAGEWKYGKVARRRAKPGEAGSWLRASVKVKGAPFRVKASVSAEPPVTSAKDEKQ
jgi:hypothetical protein